MSENSETPKRKPGKLRRALAIGSAVAVVGGVGLGLTNLKESGRVSTPEYTSYELHDTALVNDWDQRLQSVLQPGAEVRMTDLTIKIPENQTLNARYSPSVINAHDGSTGNLAVEFKPGVFTVDNALIINGDYSDINDKSSNRWAWIDGKSIGLNHGIFINLGATNSKLIDLEQSETGIIRGINPQGNVFVSSGGEVNLSPGIITFNTPTPPAK